MYLRSFCDSQKDDPAISHNLLTSDEWGRVEKVKAVLEPFNKYTKCLQSTRTTLSDFYGFWLKLKLQLPESSSDSLVIAIREEMMSREVQLFDNPSMLAALYLDPRYQCVLSQTQKEIAVHHLVNLYKKIALLESESNLENESAVDENINTSDDAIETYLKTLRGNTSNNDHDQTPNIENIVKSFDGVSVQHSIKVLDYWEECKLLYPELYKLASVIFAVPPTQTTVERAFSAFAIVLTSRRCSLGTETLQNILLVRLNK